MNSMISVSKRQLAGLAAAVATLITVGGTLTLADHYARSSLSGQEQSVSASAAN